MVDPDDSALARLDRDLAGALLLLTPLAVTIDVLFLPFFFGTILALLWLLAVGLLLTLRPRVG